MATPRHGFNAAPEVALLGRPQGQRQRRATVGVAVGTMRGAVGDLARRRADAVDRVQVFPDRPADRHAQVALLKGHPQLGKYFHLQRVGEMAKFDFAEFMLFRLFAKSAHGTAKTMV